ncbi:MAG: hypothetical protein ACRDJ4_00640 [Actinomycetota bacterium]
MWGRERTYAADPGRVLQRRGMALVVGRRGINVVRRGRDGAWRYALSLLSLEENHEPQHTEARRDPVRALRVPARPGRDAGLRHRHARAPFIGVFGEKEPAHLNFALRLSYALGPRAVTPLALTTFALGIVLIVMGDWDLFANEGLLAPIVLFLVTVVDAQLVTLPSVGRLAKLTTPSSTGKPAPPTPEISKLVRKVRIGGTLCATLLAIITLLNGLEAGGPDRARPRPAETVAPGRVKRTSARKERRIRRWTARRQGSS